MMRILLLVLLVGCASARQRATRALEGRYLVPSPGEAWAVVEPGGADHAWYNPALAATIYVDSNCGRRYAEARTVDLATELTAGLRGVTTARDEARVIGQREGVLRVHTGTLDGVAVTLAFAIVNKNACTYDLTYIAPPDTFEAGWPDYERMVAGFETL